MAVEAGGNSERFSRGGSRTRGAGKAGRSRNGRGGSKGATEGPKGTAFDAAVRMLGLREHSRFELRQKLEQKGYADAQIREALDRLVELGYVDDLRFAEMVVRQHPDLGRLGLIQQMKRRGIESQIWGPLLDNLDGDDELERALVSARRRSRQVPSDREEREKWRRRLGAYLARRGFSQSTVIAVISQLVEQSELADDWTEPSHWL